MMNTSGKIFTIAAFGGFVLSVFSLYQEYAIRNAPATKVQLETLTSKLESPFSPEWAHPLSHFGWLAKSSRLNFSWPEIAVPFFGLMLTFPMLGQTTRGVLGYLLAIGTSTVADAAISMAYSKEFGQVCAICVAFVLIETIMTTSLLVDLSVKAKLD